MIAAGGSRRITPQDWAALVALSLGMVGLYFVPDRGVQFGAFLACTGVASAGWLTLAHGVCTGRFRIGLIPALALAAALRLVMVASPPQLSTDLHRYVFEGSLVVAGENPYLHPPASDAWASYRGEPGTPAHDNWTRINHPEVPAAYPPAAQFTMAGGVLLRGDVYGQKAVFGLCDLLVFLLVWRWLKALGLPPARAIIHGFCPLAMVEFAGEGHSDSLAALGMVAALSLAASRRSWGRVITSGAALGIGIAAKFLPVVAVPFLARDGGQRLPSPRQLGLAAASAGTVLLLYLPFLAPLDEMFQGTGQYYARWSHNGSLFELWYEFTQWVRQVMGWDQDTLDELAKRVIRVPILLGGLLLLGRAWWKGVRPADALLWFFVYWLACTPTLHPWYLGFVLPFLAVRPNPGLLVFCFTVLFSYHVLPPYLLAERAGDPEPPWKELLGWKLVEYAPFFFGVYQLLRPPAARPVPLSPTGEGQHG